MDILSRDTYTVVVTTIAIAMIVGLWYVGNPRWRVRGQLHDTPELARARRRFVVAACIVAAGVALSVARSAFEGPRWLDVLALATAALGFVSLAVCLTLLVIERLRTPQRGKRRHSTSAHS